MGASVASFRSRTPKWAIHHMNAFEGVGRLVASKKDKWDPIHPSDDLMDAFPGLKQMTDRQFPMLADKSLDVTNDAAMRCRSSKQLNISQSARSQPSAECECPCITPRCQMFLCGRCRTLEGYEAMMLQGMHFAEDQTSLLQWQSEDLMKLAGNGFSVHCFLATYIVKDVIFAECKGREKRLLRPAAPIRLRRSVASCSELLLWDNDSDEEDCIE